MKKLLMILPLVILLYFTFSCKQGEEPTVEETEEEVTSGTVKIDGFELPYFIEGTGVPCIVINDAPAMSRAFSRELRKHFKFIFMDSRHNTPYDESSDISKITLDTFVDDIELVRRTLGFDKICVHGHSIFGLIALEYARKYPEHTTHVIMNGTPPYMNAESEKISKEYWESHASEERKMILKQNWEKISEDRLSSLPPGEADILRYITNGPMYWYDPKYDCSWLLEGEKWNDDVWKQMVSMFRSEYDIAHRTQITTPIFLSLGRFDYVVPYYMWDDLKEKFSSLTVVILEKSGHWAFIEEQELYDKKLIGWIKSH